LAHLQQRQLGDVDVERARLRLGSVSGLTAQRSKFPQNGVRIHSETQSRALTSTSPSWRWLQMGAKTVPHHRADAAQTNRSCRCAPRRQRGDPRLAPVVTALQQAGFVGRLHGRRADAPVETPEILKTGARILVISNEHPEALERMVPDTALEKRVRAAGRAARDKAHAGDVEGRHDLMWIRPGIDGRRLGLDRQARHRWRDWPGGLVGEFSESKTVNGTLVMAAADITSPSSAISLQRSQ